MVAGCRGQAPLPSKPGVGLSEAQEATVSQLYDDDVIIASADFQRRGAPAADAFAQSLEPYCRAGDWLACGRQLRLLTAPEAKTALIQRLRERSDELPRYTWVSLAYQAPREQQQELALKALERFHEADELLAPAGVVPPVEEGYARFALRPGFLTLMPLTMRLVQDQQLGALDSILTIAYLLGDKAVLESPDFWLIWGRVADHVKQPLRSSLCYSMAVILDGHQGGVGEPGLVQARALKALSDLALSDPKSKILAPYFHSLAKAGPSDDRMTNALSHLRRRTRELGLALSRGQMSENNLQPGVLAALLLTRFNRDPEHRREHLARAAMQSPNSIEAWRQLAMAEDDTGRRQEAVGALRNAMRLQGDDPETLNNLAYTLIGSVKDGELNGPEAEVLARRSVMLRATGASLDTLAEIVFRRGDVDSARRFIGWARKLDPESKFLRAQEARIEQGDPRIPVPKVTE